MVKKLLFIFCVMLVAVYAQAQPPCGGPPDQVPPAESCPEACIYCDFNGYMGTTGGYAPNGIPPGGFCSMIQNDQWLGFIAGAASATFTITPSNCVNGNGVQTALYESCNTAPLACNAGGAGNGNTPTIITVSMVPGTNYFLLIDGLSGDDCDISVTVSPPIAVKAPDVGNMLPIQGPATVCPGGTITMQVPNVPNAGTYTWTGPAGTLINGEPAPVTIDAPDGRIVQITFPTTTGTAQICVNANNSCDDGPTQCRNVNVQPIPPTVIPTEVVCNDELPYILPWGDEVTVAGDKTHQATLTSWQGCDSIVRQRVIAKPPLTGSVGFKYICAGGSFSVCGETFTESGQIQATCTSFQGCDSIVTGTLTVLDPTADIIGGGTLTCKTDTIKLNSAPSQSGSVKTWRRNGATVGVGDRYNVTVAGTYTLTSRLQFGGVQCEKTDTIVIAEDKAPPPAAASTNGFIGCGGAATSVTASTTTQNPTYKWSGPNGFTANTQTTNVPVAGIYTVTVTSGGNGCTGTATTEVTGNTTPPSVNTTNGLITCANITTGIAAFSSASNSAFSWTGPGGQTYNIPNPTVNQIGTYTVTVTDNTNNCTKTASATVAADTLKPTASAVPSGFITCQTPVVTLNGSTNATNPTFQWDIPSNLQNPSVDKAGTYTLVVTSGSNGCTKTVSVNVVGTTLPPQISAVADTTTLSCSILKALLDGGSTTPDVTYAWAGPNGFTAFKPDTSATEPGLYTLTVSGSNLCTSTATIQIDQNVVKPDATADGNVITCGQLKTEIKSNSTTPNVNYKWVGPGNYSSNKQVDSVANTGIYTVTVTGLNGCTQTATAEVKADSNVPDAQATGGDLTCANPSIILDGGSITPGVSLKWSGPGINVTNENDEDPLVTVDGLYTLVVTNPANGCTKIAQATVNLKKDPPGAGAIGETLTCKDPNKAIKGTSPETTVTWDWTGPAGFSSTEQNPTVSAPGVYTVTVRSGVNGCTSTAETTVLEDKAIPVPASTTGTLTCAVKKLTLNGSTNIAGTFTWEGPSGFTFTGANPEVIESGIYTVSVTPANGCTGSATVTVALDDAEPGALATGNTATCDNPNRPISADPATAGLNVTYKWEGPGLPTGSTAQAPTVSIGGIYTVTVTSVGNGCTTTATAELKIDKEAAAITIANPEVLTCSNPDFNLDATITNQTSGIKTIDWTGPSSFKSNIEDPLVTVNGVYVVIVTSDNGCPSSASVTVAIDKVPPGASAAVSGPITCKDPSVKLEGGSQTGTTYIWTIPGGGGTIPEEDPTITVDGVYALVVTAANGCTSTATVNVEKNVTPPGAQIAKSNDLDCNKTNAVLTGTPGTGVKYDWTGPGTFTSNVANPTIAVPGDYTLTTTSDVNGCTSTITVNVTQDIVNPQNPTAAGSTIDCITGTTSITSSSTTQNVTYAWTGPGTYTSNQQNPNNVTVAGTYTVTFKGTNGCTSTASAVVLENKDNPAFTLTGDGAVLTCANDTLPATATITKPAGGTGTWTGPGTFSSTNNNILVSVPGDYTFVVIDPANGCKTTKVIKVDQNIEKPKNVTAEGAQLDCDNPTVTIKSSTSTTNVSYTWAGPGGYSSKAQNPNDVTNNGTYTVTVTDNGNGCTSTATTEVTRDPSIPEITVTTETITCKQPTVVLNSTISNGIAVTYKWTGPGITPASSTIEDPSVTLPGDYTVVARANTSGCTASFNIKVNEDKVPPGVTAKGDTLNCKETNVTILSNSTTQNVTYVWTDPSGQTLTQQNPVVTLIGTYTVTVTGLNGCTSTATAVVSPDKDAPVVTAKGGLVNCSITSIQLQATTTNTGLTWSWTGPGGFTSTNQNPTVSVDGSYILVATAPNGCSITVGAEVKADKVAPVITIATPNQLNCTTTQVGLSASVAGTGNYTYLWSTTGGNIANGGTSSAPTVTLAGVYQVLVTNTLNGCTSTKEVTVTTDPATPSDMLESIRDVLCFGQTNGVIQINGITGGTPPFLYSINGKPFTAQSTFSNLKPDTYTVVVQDANGCELEQTFTVKEPELFVLNLGRDTTITLGSTIVLDYRDLVNFPDRLDKIVFDPKTINASGNSLDTLLPKHSFKYKGVAYDKNGCKATDERLIIVDRTRNIYVGNIIKPGSTTFNDRAIVWGGNDVEKIKVFQIYDRWGALVFERRNFDPSKTNSPDVDNGWDGLVKGDKGAPGVYVYYLEALFKDGETEYFKGDITLFR